MSTCGVRLGETCRDCSSDVRVSKFPLGLGRYEEEGAIARLEAAYEDEEAALGTMKNSTRTGAIHSDALDTNLRVAE